jgi:hypothetical protein
MLAALGVAGVLVLPAAFGAEGDDGRRGSVPPGTSQDGSRPNEGALKGGSLERKKDADRAQEPGSSAPELERCRDLEGTLRSQCLADARNKDKNKPPPAPR